MTAPTTSNVCPVCDTPDGDHLDWCTPQAREQRPSKERIGFLIDYWTAKLGSHRRWSEGQGMQAELMGLIYDHTIAALKHLHSAPEPEPTHFAFLIKRPRDKEAWPTIFADREGAEGYEHRASPVVALTLSETTEGGQS